MQGGAGRVARAATLRLPGLRGRDSNTLRREQRPYWQCSACRHHCSLTSGTIFASSKLSLTRWILAMHVLTQSKNNVSALELKRHLGVCYESAWLVKEQAQGGGCARTGVSSTGARR